MLMNAPSMRGWRVGPAACTLLSVGLIAVTSFVSPPAIPAALMSITGTAADPTDLGRYIGSYEFSTVTVLQVALPNGHLTAAFPGMMRPEPLTRVSGQEFRFGKADAYIRFATDPTGRVIGAVFQQNGVATTAPRIDPPRVLAIDSSISERVRAQTATPGSEAALRKLIAGIGSGNPNYAELSPQLAAGTRAILTDLQATMRPLGALRSVEFRGVDHKGWDQYVVRFERGAALWRIAMDSYGLIVGAETRPKSN